MIRLLAVLALGTALLAGCAVPVAGSASPTPGAPAVEHVERVGPEPLPAALSIPAISATSTLARTGLLPDGSLETPPVTAPMQASWWDGSPRPGAVGPAVVLGHVDGAVNGRRGQPGIFARLHELAPGDHVGIEREDGSAVQYVVRAVERHPKDAFPTSRVYGNTDGPELRLITCGGIFDRTSGHYAENVIAWAELA